MHFLLTGIGCFLLTATLHVALLRVRPGMGLLASSLGCNLAVIVVWLLLAWLGQWPNGIEATLHGVITAFFAYQLFFFLGPATADRSMTAHLLLYLQTRGHDGAHVEDLQASYAPEEFLQKRLRECAASRLTTQGGGAVSLSWRGNLMARMYSGLLAIYRLQARPQWRDSFRRCSR